MEAKDTVMSPIKLSEAIQHFPDWDLNRGNKFIQELCTYVAKAQAEVSFKAGYELCESEYGEQYAKSYQEAHAEIVKAEQKAGMQKVADWVEQNTKQFQGFPYIDDEKYQAFLKENGLEEVGADGVDTMSDGSIYKMIMDSEAEQ